MLEGVFIFYLIGAFVFALQVVFFTPQYRLLDKLLIVFGYPVFIVVAALLSTFFTLRDTLTNSPVDPQLYDIYLGSL